MVYKYTEPRGPIDADYQSPGPKYGLPGLVGDGEHDPRSSHGKGPSYSLASRRPRPDEKAQGPGPIYNPEGVFKDGPDTTPKYSLYGRQRDRSDGHQTPGPGAYASHILGPNATKGAPAYSLGGKWSGDKHDSDIPGPGTYYPGVTGQSRHKAGPSWSLSSRHRDQSLDDDIPGPGNYLVEDSVYRTGRKGAPAYSLAGRNTGSSGFVGPGPGAYSVQAADEVAWKSGPATSFGNRPRRRAKKDTSPGPGPAAYAPEFPQNTGPAYSFGGRRKERESDYSSPGPGTYKPDDKISRYGREEGHSFSLKGRHQTRTHDDIPGPGAYAAHIVGPSAIKSSPSYSITGKSRTKGYDSDIPGPGQYYSEHYDGVNPAYKSSPAYSLAGKRREKGFEAGPGPADYRVPDSTNRRGVSLGPAYSLGSRWDLSDEDGCVPGPGAYYSEWAEDSRRAKGPGWSFGIKHKSRNKLHNYKAAGPGNYGDEVTHSSAPSYSFGTSSKKDSSNTDAPGPGSYYLPPIHQKEGASFGVKHSPKAHSVRA